MYKLKKFGFYMVVFVFMLTTLFAGCAREVPKPKTKEGRFHFSVTYEVNGKEETISGVYVCKFIKATASINGWWREWDAYIEGSDLEEEFEVLTNEDGRIDLDLGLDPMYFMSDPFYDGDSPKPEFSILYNERKQAETGEFWSYDEAVLEGYGVKIISYEYDEPIENNYS